MNKKVIIAVIALLAIVASYYYFVVRKKAQAAGGAGEGPPEDITGNNTSVQSSEATTMVSAISITKNAAGGVDYNMSHNGQTVAGSIGASNFNPWYSHRPFPMEKSLSNGGKVHVLLDATRDNARFLLLKPVYASDGSNYSGKKIWARLINPADFATSIESSASQYDAVFDWDQNLMTFNEAQGVTS